MNVILFFHKLVQVNVLQHKTWHSFTSKWHPVDFPYFHVNRYILAKQKNEREHNVLVEGWTLHLHPCGKNDAHGPQNI